MDNIIKLLPDNIANQIAAGEVIQRPASVIKELVENAVDAGATYIQVEIKDAGRTLIQVIDNGKGMAPMDARMAFERHATSKIRRADDLFALTTMGFRGEALPSIAAVAYVTLQTRTDDAEQGIRIELEGSKVISSEPVACPVGANFAIKHLFFNVPARRKFLKTDETEYRHILNEVQNVAAVRPEIGFTLRHNETITLKLDPTSPKQRLIDIFGKRLKDNLLTINIDTPLAEIRGFVTKANAGRKRGAQQYFFANERYMKHPYFHRMVLNAYGGLMPEGESPDYFIYLSVDPASIDVNISPTKTEIKFEAETDIASILYSSIREVLMMGAAVPALDFEHKQEVQIPVANISHEPVNYPEPPTISPEIEMPSRMNSGHKGAPDLRLPQSDFKMPDLSDWDKFYEEFESQKFSHKKSNPQPTPLPNLLTQVETPKVEIPKPMIFGKYALYSHPMGLAIAEMQRVRYKLYYEQSKKMMTSGAMLSQRLLFPSLLELGAKETELLHKHMELLTSLGFDISDMGQSAFSVNALPDGIAAGGEELLIPQLLSECGEHAKSDEEAIKEALLRQIIRFRVDQTTQKFTPEEAQALLTELMSLPEHLVTPEGKTIISILTHKELDKRF